MLTDNSSCYNAFGLIEKTTSLQENINPALLDSMRMGNPQALTGVPRRSDQENDAIPKVAPKWLKHDRQVSYCYDINGYVWLYLNNSYAAQLLSIYNVQFDL